MARRRKAHTYVLHPKRAPGPYRLPCGSKWRALLWGGYTRRGDVSNPVVFWELPKGLTPWLELRELVEVFRQIAPPARRPDQARPASAAGGLSGLR